MLAERKTQKTFSFTGCSLSDQYINRLTKTLSDLQRFAQIILKFKTNVLQVLNFRTICANVHKSDKINFELIGDKIAGVFYNIKNGSSFIMSKSSSKNLSNENKPWCFCCLQDKTWIKMPILWKHTACFFSLLRFFGELLM